MDVTRAAAPLVLEPGQRELLESLAKSRTVEHRLVQRAQVLLRAADGMSNADNAVLAGVTRVTVRAWRSEFAERGLADLGRVAPGRGRRASIPQATIDQIVELTLHAKPEGATHWSCRSMAAKGLYVDHSGRLRPKMLPYAFTGRATCLGTSMRKA